jgi:hypothetical protein
MFLLLGSEDSKYVAECAACSKPQASGLRAVCVAKDRPRFHVNFLPLASKPSTHLNLSKKKRSHGTTPSVFTQRG